MAEGERDLRITLRVRNARMLRRIEAQGESVASFCRKYRLCPTAVSNLVRMTMAPVISHKALKTADWKPIAWFISSALHCEPEDLWPEWMRVLERRRATISFDASVEELKQIETATTMREVDVELLPRLIAGMPERMKTILLEYIEGDKTLDEIGAPFHVSRERCRQIALQGLRKARERAKNLHVDIDGSRV